MESEDSKLPQELDQLWHIACMRWALRLKTMLRDPIGRYYRIQLLIARAPDIASLHTQALPVVLPETEQIQSVPIVSQRPRKVTILQN